MANSLSHGHTSPRSDWSASCSSHCSLGTRWRESRTGCPAFLSKFIVIDSEIELHHAELVTDDLEEAFFKSEKEQALRKAIQLLKPIQKERLIKYYFEGKSSRQIAKEEGVAYSAVDNSIATALKNLRKFLI